MDTSQITYSEFIDFKKNLNNLSNDEILKLYSLYRDEVNKDELIKSVLELFPKFPGQRLELNFIDKDMTMAVVTVYRVKDDKENIVSYFSYVKEKGIMTNYFKSYDKAILGCLCHKYNNNFTSPHPWIEKMLDMKDVLQDIMINTTAKDNTINNSIESEVN